MDSLALLPKRVVQVVRPYLKMAPLIVLLGLLGAALESAGIGLIMPLLNLFSPGGGGGGGAHASGLPRLFLAFGADLPPRTRLFVIAGAIVGMIALKNLVVFATGVLSAWVYGKASHAMRNRLTERLTEVGYPFFLKESPGRLLNILSNESWRASDAIATALSMAVFASAAVVLLVFLCLLSWRMTLAVALGMVLIQLLQAVVSRQMKALSREVTSQNTRLASRMLHLVDGARLIRVFGRQSAERARFEAISDSVRGLLFRVESRRAFMPPAMEVLYAVLFMAVMLGAWATHVDFAVLAAFVVLLYRMQPHVRGLQGAAAQLQSLRGSLDAVDWLLDPADKPGPPGGAEPARLLRQELRFERVSFAFPAASEPTPVLKSASFRIAANRATALVGRSGAGKTTIVNLICRLLEPDQGAVWVDDRPLAAIDPAAWRAQLAVASHDLDLIEGTIAENIAYGADAATPEEIARAARLADAERFILELPQGYDTPSGYHGINLSSGQRQRIALARALLRDPEILILDEATSAIDGISERSIIETLKSRAGRRTTIVISHHRRTLDFCDDVVVLGEGRVLANHPLSALAGADMDGLYDGAPAR